MSRYRRLFRSRYWPSLAPPLECRDFLHRLRWGGQVAYGQGAPQCSGKANFRSRRQCSVIPKLLFYLVIIAQLPRVGLDALTDAELGRIAEDPARLDRFLPRPATAPKYS